MKIEITLDPERCRTENLWYVMMDASFAKTLRSYLWNALNGKTDRFTLDDALTEYLDDDKTY